MDTRPHGAASDGSAGLVAALWCEQQGCPGAHESAHEQPGADEANVLPVHGTSKRGPAGAIHHWCVVIHGVGATSGRLDAG